MTKDSEEKFSFQMEAHNLVVRELYAKSALAAVPFILGSTLMYNSPDGVVSGRIVEVEVYRPDDAASHSFRPMTARTEALFGPPGTVYIYFIYGMHYCINIALGGGEALLIRAVEPLDGIESMRQRRGISDIKKLCNGPAKLVQAFGIPKTLNGSSFFAGPLHLELGEKILANSIVATSRIGIKKAVDKPWRFYIKGSSFVSKL